MSDPFTSAEREFLRLKVKLAVGRISSEQFNAAVEQLTVRDAQGRVWKINPESGNWQVRDATGPTTPPERPHVIFPTPRKSHRKRNLMLAAVSAAVVVLIATAGIITFGPRAVPQTASSATATHTIAAVSIAAVEPTATLVPTVIPTPVPTSTPLPPTPTATFTPSPTATATAIPSTPTPLAPKDMIAFKYPKKYRIDYAFTVSSEEFDADELRVYQARPIDWDGQQVQLLDVSPAPSSEIINPGLGNHIYYWHFSGQPLKGGSIPFRIQFELTAYETLNRIDPSAVLPYNTPDPQYALYTRAEPFIESDDPQIVQLASQLAGSETNPYRLARKYYDYVIDNAQYKLTGHGLIGAKALLSGTPGECGDYTALFVALARAKGIPARPIVGYWAKAGTDQTHVWAEFYLEPIGWVPVDPTVGQMQPLNRNYYFGNMDNERVILHKSYNLPLEPPPPDREVISINQIPAWWVWGKGNASSVRLDVTSWSAMGIAP